MGSCVSSRAAGWAAVHCAVSTAVEQVHALLFQSDCLCTLPHGAGLIATTSVSLGFPENVLTSAFLKRRY